MKKIALFTDFSPISGGGSANLRSWLPFLRQSQVKWFHSGKGPVNYPSTCHLGDLTGSKSIWGDLIGFWRLWSLRRQAELQVLLKPLLDEEPDAYWVVAHGAGVAVGHLLRTIKPDIPIHVSVHDDPEHGIFGRSRRYRLLSRLARQPLRELLSAAKGIDVTSEGMQQYYRSIWEVNSEVLHPFVSTLPVPSFQPSGNGTLRIGHIGNIYSHEQFYSFLRGVGEYGRTHSAKVVLVIIGKMVRPVASFQACLPADAQVEALGDMDETRAVKELGRCDFVHAAYPFNRRCRVFRTTSFQTKLSTYVQAQRPIFAHTPMDSTLANAVTRFQTGLVCPHSGVKAIARHVKMIKDTELRSERFEIFRDKIFGIHNVNLLENLLLQAYEGTSC